MDLKNGFLSLLRNHWYGLGKLTTFSLYGHIEELQKFTKDLKNYQPSIKFTFTSSKFCVPSLDLDVHFLEDELITDLHIKPADRHQYLHFTTSYPNHTTRSIVDSILTRWIQLKPVFSHVLCSEN